MESAEPVLLLPAPSPRLLLPAHLPARSRDSTVVTFIIRAISSSSPAFRKFLVGLVKQLWSDPKRIGKFLRLYFARASRANPLRVLPIPKAPEFPDIMRLLQALLRKATVQAVLVATATLMVIHLSRARPVEDDDEGALLQRRLPLFARDGVWRIIAPRGPLPTLRWPPRTWTADAIDALRFDLRRREMDHSDLTLYSGVGQPVMLMAHRDCVEKNSNGNNPSCRGKAQNADGVKKTEQAISISTYRPHLDLKGTLSRLLHLKGTPQANKTVSSATTENVGKFWNDRAANAENLQGKKQNSTLFKEETKLPEKIADEGCKSNDRSEATLSKLQMCLAALPRRGEAAPPV